MSLHIRRTIPLAIAGLTGLLMIVEFIFVSKEADYAATIIRDWVVAISGFAVCIGGGNLLMTHGRTIKERTPKKWYYSALLLIVMFLYLGIGLVLTPSGNSYMWLLTTINLPLSNAMMALLAFYMFSAAVRAFQARNFESSIFLLCALVVVIANIPSTAVLSPSLAAAGSWITDVPGRGAFRGLLITAAIGGIILGIRTLAGRETSYLGRA